MRWFIRLTDGVNRIAFYLIGIALAAMVAVMFYQVLVRFVLTASGINISAAWAEELARYLMIWVIFLGAALASRKLGLIALEFLIQALPVRMGKLLRYAAIGVGMGFCAFLVVIGFQFVELGRLERSPVLLLTKSYVYLAMPVGAALMIMNLAAVIIQVQLENLDIRNFGRAEADTVSEA